MLAKDLSARFNDRLTFYWGRKIVLKAQQAALCPRKSVATVHVLRRRHRRPT